MANPEIYHGKEPTAELEKAAAERAAELREKATYSGEKDTKPEQLAEKARIEAEKQAKPTETYSSASEKEKGVSGFIIAKNPDKAYDQTMQTIQREMPAPSRTFSKVIHNKAIEKVSDVAGSTIARPNALLSGAVCAFLLVLALYAHARYFGYALSGFESIGAFILGWVIGLVFDLLKSIIRGRR